MKDNYQAAIAASDQESLANAELCFFLKIKTTTTIRPNNCVRQVNI